MKGNGNCDPSKGTVYAKEKLEEYLNAGYHLKTPTIKPKATVVVKESAPGRKGEKGTVGDVDFRLNVAHCYVTFDDGKEEVIGEGFLERT